MAKMELSILSFPDLVNYEHSKYDKYFEPDVIKSTCDLLSIKDLLIWVSINDRYSKARDYVDAKLEDYITDSKYDFLFPVLPHKAYRIAIDYYMKNRFYNDRIDWVKNHHHTRPSMKLAKCSNQDGTFHALSPYYCFVNTQEPIIAKIDDRFIKFNESTMYCLVTLSESRLALELWPCRVQGNNFCLEGHLSNKTCYIRPIQDIIFLGIVKPQTEPIYFLVRSHPNGESDFIPVDGDSVISRKQERDETLINLFNKTKFDKEL